MVDHNQCRFNVSLTEKQYSLVTVGALNDQIVSLTVSVSVPVITNDTKLVAGEELIWEVAKKAAPLKRKDTTWKDDVASATAKAKAKARGRPTAAVGLANQSEV